MIHRMILIHGYLISTWTRTACMTCLEKGTEYELVPVAYGSAEHFAMHPFGRMPVLERIEPMVGDTEFLVGETLTLADLYLAPQISNCREKAPQLLQGLFALGAWFAGIQARESFQRTSYAA